MNNSALVCKYDENYLKKDVNCCKSIKICAWNILFFLCCCFL